jgi:hypothetical protein
VFGVLQDPGIAEPLCATARQAVGGGGRGEGGRDVHVESQWSPRGLPVRYYNG